MAEWLVVALKTKGGKNHLILCPFCGEVHVHGDDIGPRTAHCVIFNTPGYTLVDPPNAEIDEALREKLKKGKRTRGYAL